MLLKFAKQGGVLKELGVHWGVKKPSETLVHTLTATLMALQDRIHWPDKQEQKQLRDESRMYKKAVGAGDGTSSPTTRRKGQYSGHRNGFVRNSQAIVDPNNRVIFAAGGFGGSASDAAQLDSTGILGKLEDGNVILADSAYKTLNGVLAAGSEEAKEDPKAFVKSRSRIEHLFARMKKHFRVIDQRWCAPGKYITQAQLFVLCAILHNCMLDYGHFKKY
jgi:DDE superfamily endonuclease